MKSPLSHKVLHPFLLVLFPIVSLFSNNIRVIHIEELFRPVIVGILISGLILLLFFLLNRNWHRAGVAVSAVEILFFSFGHVYSLVNQLAPQQIISQANILAAIWAVMLILSVWASLRLLKNGRSWTYILNITSAILLLVSGVNIVPFLLQNATSLGNHPSKNIDDMRVIETDEKKPDIYYLILDGYARNDVLQGIYGIEHNELLDFLKERGFYIAQNSHTNYGQTVLSLASSLNYDYLPNLAPLNPISGNLSQVESLLKQNRVFSYLKKQGYKTVSSSTGYLFTEIKDSDTFLPGIEWLNPTESMLLQNSLAVFWMDQMEPEFKRNSIQTGFKNIENAITLPGPKVVFVHILLPHPPFVYDREGNPVNIPGGSDGNHYTGSHKDYIKGYAEQVRFANHMIEQAINQIFEKSQTPPVIILQGDHGPASLTNFDSPKDTCVWERFSILNAYYFPQMKVKALYPEISPVNTFRVLFNAYFGEQIPLEEDRSYFSTWSKPYQFVEVTNRLQDPCGK